MPATIPQVASPRNASPSDPSFYELPPGGRDYVDTMATVIGRLVPGYGAGTELGRPSGELCRILNEQMKSAGPDCSAPPRSDHGAGEHPISPAGASMQLSLGDRMDEAG